MVMVSLMAFVWQSPLTPWRLQLSPAGKRSLERWRAPARSTSAPGQALAAVGSGCRARARRRCARQAYPSPERWHRLLGNVLSPGADRVAPAARRLSPDARAEIG